LFVSTTNYNFPAENLRSYKRLKPIIRLCSTGLLTKSFNKKRGSLSALFVGTAFAQTETARIAGTVTDQSGAVVAGATVTITSLATNRQVAVQTGDEARSRL